MRVAAGVITVAAVAIACEPTAPAARTSYAWSAVGRPGFGPPAADSANVYFTSQPDSHVVHAFDKVTGKARWTASTGTNTVGNGSNVGCFIVGPLVVCGDNGLSALQRVDGTLAWRFSPAGQFVGANPGSVNSSETRIFMPSMTKIFAVDATTGAAVWTTTVLTQASSVGSTASDDDLVVAPYTLALSGSGGVVALDANTGTVRWTTAFPVLSKDTVTAAFGIALGSGLVFASSRDGRVFGINRTTGEIQWTANGVGISPASFSNGYPVGLDQRQLAVSGSTLIASSTSGWLTGYDAATGAVKWRAGNSYLGTSRPLTIDPTSVYLTSSLGTLTSASISSGAIRWGTSVPPIFWAPPAVSGDRVFAGALEGYYAIQVR